MDHDPMQPSDFLEGLKGLMDLLNYVRVVVKNISADIELCSTTADVLEETFRDQCNSYYASKEKKADEKNPPLGISSDVYSHLLKHFKPCGTECDERGHHGLGEPKGEPGPPGEPWPGEPGPRWGVKEEKDPPFEDLINELAGLARILGWTDDTTYLQMLNDIHNRRCNPKA